MMNDTKMEEKIASNEIPRFYNDDLLKRENAVEAINKIVKELREGDETEQIMADGAIYALRAIKVLPATIRRER